jgi:hypothetical protein
MKTPNLDNIINDLKIYERNNMLSNNGRNQLNEYEAIKRALSQHDVSEQSKLLIAFADWVFDQPKHLGGRERELVSEYLNAINSH